MSKPFPCGTTNTLSNYNTPKEPKAGIHPAPDTPDVHVSNTDIVPRSELRLERNSRFPG